MQMETSPCGVGEWRPLHVRQAMSRGSVVPAFRLGKGSEFLPTQPWHFTFSTSALWTRSSGESDVVVHDPIAGVRQASIFIKLVIKHIKLHVTYEWLLCYRSMILLPAAAIRYNRLEPCIVLGYLTQTIERVNIHLYSLLATKVTRQEHRCLRIHIRCQYQRVLEKQTCKTTESSSNSISSRRLNEVKFNTVSCYPTTVVLHRKKSWMFKFYFSQWNNAIWCSPSQKL